MNPDRSSYSATIDQMNATLRTYDLILADSRFPPESHELIKRLRAKLLDEKKEGDRLCLRGAQILKDYIFRHSF
jgi:hypothetical protein